MFLLLLLVQLIHRLTSGGDVGESVIIVAVAVTVAVAVDITAVTASIVESLVRQCAIEHTEQRIAQNPLRLGGCRQ